MAKVRNPRTLSDEFGIKRKTLSKLDVLDPTLAIDTKLFIDPLLLSKSKHKKFAQAASDQYQAHFQKIIKLLAHSKAPDDVAWRTAEKLLRSREIQGTCLGYGASSIHGSGIGKELARRLIGIAKEIVDMGIDDPTLFLTVGLFEEDFGPDRISDMTTNAIKDALIEFNADVLKKLGKKGQKFDVGSAKGIFLTNPLQKEKTPIIFVPRDVLRELPIAKDWDDVAKVAAENEVIRNKVNSHIAEIWEKKTLRDKEKLKSQALSSHDAFRTLLDAIHAVAPIPYDSETDPEGLLRWTHEASRVTKEYPLNLKGYGKLKSLNRLSDVVAEIIKKFRFLVEQKGLNKELYKTNGHPRHESTAQRLFFAVSYCYCLANDIDISPEVDTGNGKVDFKFSKGSSKKMLVEIKLSTNSNLTHGYETQLEIYKKNESSMRAAYVVIDVGKMGNKEKRLIDVRNEARQKKKPLSDLEFIDGSVKASASVRGKKKNRKRGIAP